MKVPFILPDEGQRAEIWKTLVPPKVTIASDVDFREFAKKYVFTGGLIKNTIFICHEFTEGFFAQIFSVLSVAILSVIMSPSVPFAE